MNSEDESAPSPRNTAISIGGLAGATALVAFNAAASAVVHSAPAALAVGLGGGVLVAAFAACAGYRVTRRLLTPAQARGPQGFDGTR